MSDFTEAQIRVLRALADAALGAAGGGVAAVADDRDLDGQYGDPAVKFAPKRWTGPDFARAAMSTCSPEFLDAYADALQYSSEHPKSGKEKYAPYDARDAARARGWAKRLRAGWKRDGAAAKQAASAAEGSVWTGDDEIPF